MHFGALPCLHFSLLTTSSDFEKKKKMAGEQIQFYRFLYFCSHTNYFFGHTYAWSQPCRFRTPLFVIQNGLRICLHKEPASNKKCICVKRHNWGRGSKNNWMALRFSFTVIFTEYLPVRISKMNPQRFREVNLLI